MTDGSVSGRQRGKFGIFSFFTGAGFLDLGFEDVSSAFYIFNAETQRCREGEPI